MDQYVINFSAGFLYWDLFELYHLIKDSNNKRLHDYLDVIKHKLNEAEPNTIE